MAARASSGVAPGRPRATFSSTVPRNRKPSWGSTTIRSRMWDSKAFAQVNAAEADRAGRGVVQAAGQLGQGRLPAAGGADQGQALARLDAQVHPFQDEALVELVGIQVVVGVDAVGEVDTDRSSSVPVRGRGDGRSGSTMAGSTSSSPKTVAMAAPEDWRRSNRADRLVMALNRLARYSTKAATIPTVVRWAWTKQRPGHQDHHRGHHPDQFDLAGRTATRGAPSPARRPAGPG